MLFAVSSRGADRTTRALIIGETGGKLQGQLATCRLARRSIVGVMGYVRDLAAVCCPSLLCLLLLGLHYPPQALLLVVALFATGIV